MFTLSTFFLLESPKWSGPRGPQGPEFGPLYFKGPKGPEGPRGPRVNFSLFLSPKAPRRLSINFLIFVSPKDLKLCLDSKARKTSVSPYILLIFCIFLIQETLGPKVPKNLFRVDRAQRTSAARKSPRICS